MKMLTVTETAKALGVTSNLIRIYIRHGLFPGAVKVRGTRWRIPAAAVDLFDGTDVSGSFAKIKKEPFCRVEKELCRDRESQWLVMSKKAILTHMSTEVQAVSFAKKLNEAVENWAENA